MQTPSKLTTKMPEVIMNNNICNSDNAPAALVDWANNQAWTGDCNIVISLEKCTREYEGEVVLSGDWLVKFDCSRAVVVFRPVGRSRLCILLGRAHGEIIELYDT